MLWEVRHSVSTTSRLDVCNCSDDDLYDTCRQLEVGVIEVPLGVNVIPKGTALGYSAINPMYSAYALLRKNVLVLFSFPTSPGRKFYSV